MKVIAEIGSNWKTFDDCIESIRIAKKCGADAVKFQYFNKFEMYGGKEIYDVSTPHLPSNWLSSTPDHSLGEWGFKPSLPGLAKEIGIEFMCTAFSPDGYSLIDKYVQTHKIASAEITDLNILSTVNSFKKPVYLSTGGADISQIETALAHLKDCAVTIMFCVTAYPARVVDFRHLQNMKDELGPGYSYGYSDHSTDVLNIPRLAQKHGCTVIEKHVNFTNHTDTDDAPHSLNAKEFELMVKAVKGRDISPRDTFTPCTWQRVLTDEGYFRPRNEAEL